MVIMTKTANNFSNNGMLKRSPKSAKNKQNSSAVSTIRKKLLMTKEQEASIAETITYVIKSKVCSKNLRKSRSATRQDVPTTPLNSNKSPKRVAKDKSNTNVAKDDTAEKTAAPIKSNKTAKKEVNNINSLVNSKTAMSKRHAQITAASATNKKVVKRTVKLNSPSTRSAKPDNKGELQDKKVESKPDAKQTTGKQKQEEKEKENDAIDKSPTRKDKQDKDKEKTQELKSTKLAKDKKSLEKIIKDKKSDSMVKKTIVKNKKQQISSKVVKSQTAGTKKLKKEAARKAVSVKVNLLDLQKLNKPAKSCVVNGLKTSANKSAKDTEPEEHKKGLQKLNIKEEQLDEVIAAILKSSSKGEKKDKPSSIKQNVKKVTTSDNVTKKKVKPSILAQKLKTKLKVTPITASAKNNVIVKKKNNKTKLVATKPVQQIKSRKLLSIWNGPKRHRVASLNAMAKVHCLYDNEFRGNFDQLELNVKRELAEEKEEKKACKSEDGKRTRSMKNERQSVSPQPTRTLRSVPGLRAVGKMWDMHDTTSSSEDDYQHIVTRVEKPKKVAKPAVAVEKRPTTVIATVKPKKPVVKRRKKEEVVMDLKDMVVRKRMASLNASAILAASYSVEKRTHPRGANSDSETTTDSEEEYSSDERSGNEEYKEEKVNMRATPSKKVAVILNQDTDVTFTGVYMNSTTRSTHHEGYCHIAGMKYRISATSHTQTAATAVATETILQSTTTTTHENENADATPVKSYTPLDALSNMQPPANAAGALQPHHHHLPPQAQPVPAPTLSQQHHHHHHHVGHTQHVHHASTDVGPIGRRHGCGTSAFSAPPPVSGGCGPQVHQMAPEHGYVQGYYQPAGPLISVHGHSAAPPLPTLNTKSVPLSEASPTSTSPLLQPPPPSSAGDSSDSEVIITSVTTAKEAALASQQPPPATAYRLNHHYPPPPPPSHGAYSAYGSYPPQYYGAPPPPPGPAAYPHHDMCYTSFPPPKYMFRRYLAPPAPPYYQPGSPDLYTQPPNTNQQVVTASSSSSGSYQSSSTGPPPPTLMDPYPGPLIETYPPSHYYQGYGPATQCFTHSPPARPISYINATYQTCPCPMQSCPKNVHTGPLAGDSKRSNITIAKESMPLPPVALALPLEPASATGPPSPARGSAGMPPPPSPAGATYQPPPPPKQETPEPAVTDTTCQQQVEKRRKARVGKAMVRNTIAQSQQNTMLLMCQTQVTPNATILENVKREVESPKDEPTSPDVNKTIVLDNSTLIATKLENVTDIIRIETDQENNIKCEKPEVFEKFDKQDEPKDRNSQSESVSQSPPAHSPKVVASVAAVPPPSKAAAPSVDDELLLPCQKTVAENVKVKNMKRKCSLSKETDAVTPVIKRARLEKPNGSYKDLIKKTQNVVKINNGKRKLISASRTINGILIRIRNGHKRKPQIATLIVNKEENGKRQKPTKPLTDSNVPQNVKANGAKDAKSTLDPELIENKEPNKKTGKKQSQPHSQQTTKKLLNTNPPEKLSNLDKTIESVVHNLRKPKPSVESGNATPRVDKTDRDVKAEGESKRVTNGERTAKKVVNKAPIKVKRATEAPSKTGWRRSQIKPKEVPQAIARVPRRSTQLRWSNGWRWHGEAFDGKVFLNSDEATVIRKCYPAMVHEEGDIIEPRDCVLLKAGQRKNELPFVAKIAALWENPDDGEMMMSLLWYYRPEHTEQGRLPADQPDEVFASRHKDSNSVACIEDKCYVLTYNEYCRYRKDLRRLEACVEDTGPCIPHPDKYPRLHRQPPSTLGTSIDLVFFCRRVYDFRQKRIIKNPS